MRLKSACLFGVVMFANLLASFCFAQGTPKTKTSLGTEISAQLPDQTNNYITPLILRNVINDIVSSFQQFASVNAQTGTSYTIQSSDYGQLLTLNNASAVAVTIPTTSSSLSAFYPFNTYVSNLGAGIVTITPVSGTINGSSNITISQGQSIWIVSDGNAWQVFKGFGSGVSGTNGQVYLGVTGASSQMATMSQDCAITNSGVITCLKTNNVAFGPFATQSSPCTIAQGCSSQSTVLTSRGSSGFNIDALTSTGDANYVIPSTSRGLYHTALSAARTDTLPAASSVNPGQELHITDFAGVATASNTVTLQRAGSDTINGTTSVVAINAQYGAGIFWSDGVSRWTFQPISTAAGSGTVTQVVCGTGLSGGTITTTGTCAIKDGYASSASCTITDQSGASLSITTNYCNYSVTNNVVTVVASISYPSTASGVNSLISLPVAVPNHGTFCGSIPFNIGGATLALGAGPCAVTNSSTLAFYSLITGSRTVNSTLSAGTFTFSLTYPAT